MRALTRDLAAEFTTRLDRLAADPGASAADAATREAVLRFRLGVVAELTRASTGLSPRVSLLDTWAFAEQLRAWLGEGDEAQQLGPAQAAARALAADLADGAESVARRTAGAQFMSYRTFVRDYVRQHPLTGPPFARDSVLAAWSARAGRVDPLRADGTVAQALGDVSDRMRIYGERVPKMGLWEAELALDRAGVDGGTYREALSKVDAELAHISTLADTSPALVREAVGNLRASLRETADRLDAAWAHSLVALREEREALNTEVGAQRRELTSSFDEQRAKISSDAARIAERAVDVSWRELKSLVREAMALAILAMVLAFGMPFAAGYWVGRRRAAASLPPEGRTG